MGKFDDALRIVTADQTDWKLLKDYGVAKVYYYTGAPRAGAAGATP